MSAHVMQTFVPTNKPFAELLCELYFLRHHEIIRKRNSVGLTLELAIHLLESEMHHATHGAAQ